MVSEKMYGLGTRKSTIRTIFEFGRKRAAEIGEENVYDFSIGNPNVPAPAIVNQTIIDTIKDSNHMTPHEACEEKNIKSQLESALKRLPERERMIMVLYYHENMTFKEIGETVNISESRVCQIHAQAIMKLKNLLSENRSARMKQSII